MTEPVIKCENVYKIFGANAQKMLHESNGNVDAKTFQKNGCIVGVNNASFKVSKATTGSKLVKTVDPFLSLHSSSAEELVLKSALTAKFTIAGVLLRGLYPKFCANETIFFVSTALLM